MMLEGEGVLKISILDGRLPDTSPFLESQFYSPTISIRQENLLINDI